MLSRPMMRGAVVLLLSACAGCATTPPTLPDTSAARKLTLWLDAYNSGDGALIEQFVRTEMPDPGMHTPIVASMQDMRRRTGPYDIEEIESASETQIVVLLDARNDQAFAQAVMSVDASGRIADLSVVPTGSRGTVSLTASPR